MTSEARRKIPLCRPMFGAEEEAAVAECLRSGWVTSGPRVAEFEKAFAAKCGCEDALATSSGTAALHLALWSLDLKPGDEVITPALTWVSVPNLVALLGARPVFCDVDPSTLNIDLEDAARVVTSRTRAIVPVQFAGRPLDMAAVHAFASAHRLTVIEDAAHAVGASHAGKPVGSHSELVAFSFHPNKNISTGEGGMLTGRNRDRLALARQLRYHGVAHDTYRRSGAGLPHYDTLRPGVKYIMTDIAASIGLCQLAKLEDFNAKRARLGARYRAALSPLANRLWLPSDDDLPAGDHHVWHLFTVRVEDREGLRDRVMQELVDDGIGVGLHYRPVHEMSWVRACGYHRSLPATEMVGRTILSLPLYPGLSDSDVDAVVDALRRAVLPHAAQPMNL